MFLVFLRSSGTRHYVKVLRALRFPVTLVPSQSVPMGWLYVPRSLYAFLVITALIIYRARLVRPELKVTKQI